MWRVFFLVYEVLINDPLMTGAQNTEECHDSGKLIVTEDNESYEDLKSQVNWTLQKSKTSFLTGAYFLILNQYTV